MVLYEGSDVPVAALCRVGGSRGPAPGIVHYEDARRLSVWIAFCVFSHIYVGILALLLLKLEFNRIEALNWLTNRSFSRMRCVVLFSRRMVKGHSSDA